MANLSKHTRNGTANLFAHYDRTLKNNSNRQIDSSRTYLNYNLAPDKTSSPTELLTRRLDSVKVLKRKDVNVLCSWVVTLPKDFDGDERKFFQATYDFLEKKYGSKNVISAWVHRDEKQPHLHFAFVPVVLDRKKGIEKVSAKECVTKMDLMTFHPELQAHLEKALGQEVHILNGATANGNLTVRELKTAEREKTLARRERDISEYEIKLATRDAEISERERRERSAAEIAEKTLATLNPVRDGVQKCYEKVCGLLRSVVKMADNLRTNLNEWESLSPDKLEQRARQIRNMMALGVRNWHEYREWQKRERQRSFRPGKTRDDFEMER